MLLRCMKFLKPPSRYPAGISNKEASGVTSLHRSNVTSAEMAGSTGKENLTGNPGLVGGSCSSRVGGPGQP